MTCPTGTPQLYSIYDEEIMTYFLIKCDMKNYWLFYPSPADGILVYQTKKIERLKIKDITFCTRDIFIKCMIHRVIYSSNEILSNSKNTV